MLRSCMNAIHRGGAILRDNSFLLSSNRVVVQGKDDYWLFFLETMSNPLDWINCVVHIQIPLATECLSVLSIQEGTFWVEKLTYHLMQCDGTTAQLINATKEVSCVYNQAVISQYRKKPEQKNFDTINNAQRRKHFRSLFLLREPSQNQRWGNIQKMPFKHADERTWVELSM